ncbi:Hpt domain-containing protein [Vibrio sp. HDW18]|uniref:quorum-sensing phosphorelay protein LuxU n=1 Tax=Vibrio sp. HDW18 TaxID=2714948 RepID=UPI001407EB94|nr:quorum-sensing phosphorelay protein LuxU [Vibrio sp. HDW18]QIL86576.1 Hpt domain-containing protein [Vibrio sp. HDW18]
MREWINQSQIDVLAKEIGAENIPLLLNIFVDELNAYQRRLRSEPHANQREYLQEISHALKSSAASFGAERLRGKAIELDRLAHTDLTFDLAYEVEQMLELLGQTHQRYLQLVD